MSKTSLYGGTFRIIEILMKDSLANVSILNLLHQAHEELKTLEFEVILNV